mmetsp:Transcript_42583/g.48931  ORF Transcript_42583/g.48931 Transcript_42583/m.48931 type:complete len:90 (-) Transcript_42583:77-346(-)
MIKCNKTLREIYLGDNKLTDIGAKILGESLSINNTLRVFSVERCGLKQSQAMAIASGAKMSALIKLDLSYNYGLTDWEKIYKLAPCAKR